jgi:hypothetical protein
MKRKNLKSIITSMIILKRSTNLKSVNQFIESALILMQSTQVGLDQLQLSQLIEIKKIINIVMIEVVAYRILVKKKKIKIFSLTISEINKVFISVKSLNLKLNEMISVMSLKELKNKLSIVYHDFLNVFNKEKTIYLSLHRSYDHKIELEEES